MGVPSVVGTGNEPVDHRLDDPSKGALMLIDCDACTARGPACGDCLVIVLLRTVPPARDTGVVELDGAEQAAIAVLAGSGLVPPLRLVPTSVRGSEPKYPSPSSQVG